MGETHHTRAQPCTVGHVRKLSDLQHCTVYTHILYLESKQMVFPVQWMHANSSASRMHETEPLFMDCIPASHRCNTSSMFHQRAELLLLCYTPEHVDSPVGSPNKRTIPINWQREQSQVTNCIISRFATICIRHRSTQVLNKRARYSSSCFQNWPQRGTEHS